MFWIPIFSYFWRVSNIAGADKYLKILFLFVSKTLYVGEVHISFDINILNIVGY